MILKLENLEVACIIGDRPEERVRVQTLRLQAELEIDARASETDQLSDTVDYASLAGKIRAALVAAKCQLIERAAKVVYDVCRAERGVRTAQIRVTKSGTVPGLGSATITYP